MGYLLIFLSVCSNLAEGMIVKLQGKKNTTNGFIFNAMIALASMLFFVFTKAGTLAFSKFSYGEALNLMCKMGRYLINSIEKSDRS